MSRPLLIIILSVLAVLLIVKRTRYFTWHLIWTLFFGTPFWGAFFGFGRTRGMRLESLYDIVALLVFLGAAIYNSVKMVVGFIRIFNPHYKEDATV